MSEHSTTAARLCGGDVIGSRSVFDISLLAPDLFKAGGFEIWRRALTFLEATAGLALVTCRRAASFKVLREELKTSVARLCLCRESSWLAGAADCVRVLLETTGRTASKRLVKSAASFDMGYPRMALSCEVVCAVHASAVWTAWRMAAASSACVIRDVGEEPSLTDLPDRSCRRSSAAFDRMCLSISRHVVEKSRLSSFTCLRGMVGTSNAHSGSVRGKPGAPIGLHRQPGDIGFRSWSM